MRNVWEARNWLSAAIALPTTSSSGCHWRLSLTSPACPYGPMLLATVHGALAKVPGVRDVDIDLTFEPTWDPRAMATEEAKEQLGIY